MFLAAVAFAIVAQAPAPDFSRAWTGIRSSIEGRYYARQQDHKKMESLLDKYGREASSAKTQGEFEKDVNDMIADFGDSHFGFFTKSDQEFYLMQSLVTKDSEKMPSVGAWFRPEGTGYAIQMLLNGGAAEDAGLRQEDIVTKVDGEPFSPVDSLRPKVGRKVKLTYLRNGAEATADVDVTEVNGHSFFLDATKASEREIDVNGKKYGYIHLWTMSDEDEKNALASAVYGRFSKTDGFILDIRDGFGGRPEGFGDPFFRPEVTLDWVSPGYTQHELFGYQKPLVVIIDGGSRSAKEVFAYIMKESKRATLVGHTTAGNVLGTWPSAVGDWAFLEIPIVDVRTNGVRLEKAGVTPDVPVAKEFDSEGKDLYLQTAVQVLSQKVAAAAGGRHE